MYFMMTGFIDSTEPDQSKKKTVLTQVGFGGFNRHFKAKEIAKYLEQEVGLVWRCRLMTYWTPPASFPDFNIDIPKVQRTDDHLKVEPHLALLESATGALDSLLGAVSSFSTTSR